MSGIAPVNRFTNNPRTLAITFWGEFGPPKKAPPSLENSADSPPLDPSEDATVLLFNACVCVCVFFVIIKYAKLSNKLALTRNRFAVYTFRENLTWLLRNNSHYTCIYCVNISFGQTLESLHRQINFHYIWTFCRSRKLKSRPFYFRYIVIGNF